MKKIFLSLVALTVANLAAAQSSCCTRQEASAFAAMASDPSFAQAHENPRPFVLQEKTGRNVTFKTPGGRDANGYLIEKKGSDLYVLVFHEWWGLNDYIRRESERIYKELGTVNVLAVDLFDGKVATTRDSASKYASAMTAERGEAIIKGAMDFAGKNAKFETIGWCFGGGWSLRASIMASDRSKACVVFYGTPETDQKKLKPLRAPVLFIWAMQDKWINATMVADFEKAMLEAKKGLVLKKYNADHAFANPSNPAFNNELTKDAFNEAFKFMKAELLR